MTCDVKPGEYLRPLSTLADFAEVEQVNVFLNMCKIVRSIRKHGIYAFKISPEVFHYRSDQAVIMEFKGLDYFPDVCCKTFLGPWGFPYAPPEAWDTGIGKAWIQRVTSEKAAVWALGATMYEINPPFCHELREYIDWTASNCAVMCRARSRRGVISMISASLNLAESKRPGLAELIERVNGLKSSMI